MCVKKVKISIIVLFYSIFGVQFTFAQSRYDFLISSGIGLSQYRFKNLYEKRPNRLNADYSPLIAFFQSLDLRINKKGKAFFKRIGLQHHSAMIRVRYFDFKNPLIQSAEAHQAFELRYFAYPVGFGHKFHVSQKSALSLSVFSEILATYRLRPVSSSIEVIFRDNSVDNLAKITNPYDYYGNVIFGNLGGDINYSLRISDRMNIYSEGSFIWMPQSTTWFGIGAVTYAGGQIDYYGIGSPRYRYLFSMGLNYSI